MTRNAELTLTTNILHSMANYIKLLRIRQWIKNVFVFVPLVFSKLLFSPEHFLTALLGFFAFCLTSSSVYIINDLFDVELDRIHPKKKLRPIASGAISKFSALITFAVLIFAVAFITRWLDNAFILVLGCYIVINILYSIKLKHLVIIDIMTIAAGFMLRVLAGGFVISVYISSWLILTTLFVSLFLAIMKRRSELNLHLSDNLHVTRKVLAEYTVSFTEQMASISAAGVIICYALYSVSERTINYLHNEYLVYTTIFVVFGIFRFMYLVYKKSQGENATEMLVTDVPMIVNAILYTITTVIIVYH